MPDVHYAGPCPVGFTCSYSLDNGVVPAIIGGDIGCGLLEVEYAGMTELLNTDDKSRLFQCIQKAITEAVSFGQDLTKFESDNEEKQWL